MMPLFINSLMTSMGLIPSKLASCLTVRAAGKFTILGWATTVSFVEAAVETVSDPIAGPAGLGFATGRCAGGFPVVLELRAGLEAILPFVAGLAALLVASPALLGLLSGLPVKVLLFLACVVPDLDGLVPAFLAVVWVERPFFDASAGLLVFSLPVALGLAAVSLITDLGGWTALSVFLATLPFDAGSDDFFLFSFSSFLT
jgi:hypothetical protein